MQQVGSSERPNLLIILSDQLRRDALGIYGDPNVSTPNIDRLASQGVRFGNACSTYPICVPTRFSMMTGEYAHSRFVPAIEWRLSPAERTLADEFNEAGYHTMYCGKWHLFGGHGLLPNHPARKANLTWVPPEYQGRWKKWLGFELANNPFDTYYFEDADPTPRPLGKYQTDGLFELTIDHLKGRLGAEQPFCCLLSVEPPHFPLAAPEAFISRWEGREIELPANFLYRDEYPAPGQKLAEKDREEAIRKRRIYYAMIENLDWNVGRMLTFLEESGLAHNTIVILLSDHGQMDGAHSEASLDKQHPFEESIGIPLIVRDPRLKNRSGMIVEDPLCTEDLYPTFLGLAGLESRAEKPGMDITPVMRGELAALPREGVLLEFVHELRLDPYLYLYHDLYWRGFRTRRFKYTVLGDARQGGRPWQFYDLSDDPYEMRNLIDTPASRELIARHHRMLRERLIETRDHYVLAAAFGMPGLNLWE